MPNIREVGGKVRYSIERFDGGYNVKESPSKISPYESPDCLNVVFDDAGAVATRDGTSKFNTTAIGTLPIYHGISYNGNMIVWANQAMYTTSGSVSGSTFTKITTTSGKFQTAPTVAALVYQNVLFCSDGVNGPWKYTGNESFFNMGIDIPSAPTGVHTVTSTELAAGTYYYGVAFVNSQAVEGEIGSVSAGVTLPATGIVNLSQIPVGSSLAGVNQRFIYRAESASGPFRRVGTISDNTTTTFVDNTPVGAEGKFAVEDGTSPTPFTTIELHKERLFFDDADNRSFIRWTESGNPYVSLAESNEPFDNGDGENIIAIASQDDFVTGFKENKAFSFEIVDPADDLTWIKRKLPSNLGIVGPKAWDRVQNGIIFVGRQNNKLTGFHFLSGMQVQETSDGKLRTLSISEKIEYDLLRLVESDKWSEIVCKVFENRLHMSYTRDGELRNQRIFWLDLNRVGTEGQPGSWAPWDGIPAQCLFEHDGVLYWGDSSETGFVRRFNSGSYSDSGSAINSYFWTKDIGGQDDGDLDSYFKDLRELYVWHAKLGDYNMSVRYRVDGDSGSGTAYNVDLSEGGSLWGSMIWGVDAWGGNRTDFEERIVIGRVLGKRFQVRFDNQNTAGQGFKVYRLEVGMNLRRRR